MSDDEQLFVFGLGAAGCIMLWRWYRRVLGVEGLGATQPVRWPLLVLPLVCLVVLLAVLNGYADDEVRANAGYQFLFAGAWGVAVWFMSFVGRGVAGVDPIGQGLQRRNPSALWAAVGIWLGTTLVAAGSNVGEGPTIYTTLGPCCVAVLALASLWVIFDGVTGNGRVVAVERDTSAGIRLAGWLTAWGLILGRAVAGDWESSEGMLRDFGQGAWPAALWLMPAIAIELAVRPTVREPRRASVTAGVIPAVIGVGFAVTWILWVGGWDGRPWSQTLAGPR